jgi:hypothetical protein
MLDISTSKPDVTGTLARWSGRLAAAAFATVPLTGAVAAQSAADEAGSAVCGTGLGPLITLVFGFVALALVVIALFRGAIAWNNMGSARSDKKQQGREQLKGAGLTLVGAFVPALMLQGLDSAGVPTLSCVDFGNIVFILPNLPV